MPKKRRKSYGFVRPTPYLETLKLELLLLLYKEGPLNLVKRRLGVMRIYTSQLRTVMSRAQKEGLIEAAETEMMPIGRRFEMMPVFRGEISLTEKGRSYVEGILNSN